ncbi:MAG: hypothetical protein PVF83_02180 [Anaerolineales bacterium]|jgi:hypothetical protein
MNTKIIGVVSFFAGLVLALASAFFDLGAWTVQVLIVLGILTGVFHFGKEDLVPLGVIYLGLAAAANAMDSLALVGPFITDIVSAWVGFLGPVVLTALMLWGGALLLGKKAS